MFHIIIREELTGEEEEEGGRSDHPHRLLKNGYNLQSIEEINVWHDFSKETWCFHAYPNVEISSLILSKFNL